jgi:hypothetical protein
MATKKSQPRQQDDTLPDNEDGRDAKLIDKPGFRENHPVERERAARERQREDGEARERQAHPPAVTQTVVNPVSTELRDGANQPAAPQQAVAKDPEAPREPNQDAPPPRHHQPGLDHLKGRAVKPV